MDRQPRCSFCVLTCEHCCAPTNTWLSEVTAIRLCMPSVMMIGLELLTLNADVSITLSLPHTVAAVVLPAQVLFAASGEVPATYSVLPKRTP